MNMHRIIFCLSLSCVFLTSHCLLKGDKATFKGGKVSESEIKEKIKSQLYELEEREYRLKRNAIEQLAIDKILELEAREQKTNPGSLIDAYVEKNFQPPSQESILDFYNRNKSRINKPFAEAKNEIFDNLLNYSRNNAKQQYFNKLKQKYALRINLSPPRAPVADIDVSKEPFWGKSDAKVVVVEYSDFECPYCQRMQPDVLKIRGEFQDKIKWVFKDFPLSFHKLAKRAHTAANCAFQQDKYFEFQSKVFEARSDISLPRLYDIARQIGLSMNDFEKCLEDKKGEIAKEIEQDIQDGVKDGVSGTPTIFVNGQKASNFRNYDGMKNTLNEELEKVGG